MQAQAAEKPIGRKNPKLVLGDVVDTPEAWTRPGDNRRPYSFTVRLEMSEPTPEVDKEGAPTPEQLAKGGYERPTERGSLAVYTNTHPDILAKLRAHATLTERQLKAGRAFEALWVAQVGYASPSRDSTILPIGGVSHETESQAERWARLNGRLKLIIQQVGPWRYNLLISVCCFGEGLGPANFSAGRIHRRLLRDALDVCADIFWIER